ncbi:unnamed protein product [Symbiodinium sp. CCMP2592]|nr:unnamed protein product [Symbiodinium sp. CCMP2592]
MGPSPQEQKALDDLWWYVRRQGGVLTSGRLTGFCQKFPAHGVKHFKQLCKSSSDFIVVDRVDGGYTIRLVWAEEEAVRDLAAFIRSLGRPLRSKEFPDFQSSHQASATVVYSGDRTLRKFCQEHGDIFAVDSTPDSPAFSIRLSTQAPSEEQLLSDILQFVREQGGSVSSECFQGFFGGHRWRREAIPNLKAFFARHTDHFAVSEATNSPHWRVTLAPSASSAKLAARLAIFLEDCGRPMACDQLEGFCKENPALRNIVECGRLRRFCEKHPGLLVYEALSKETDKVKLPKHCCLFLRGICNFDAPHGNYLHANPLPAGAIRCGYGRRCQHVHWQSIERVADLQAKVPEVEATADATESKAAPPDAVSDSESSSSESGTQQGSLELCVSDIGWSHDSIKVRFRNGVLLVQTLKELVDGRLLPSQLPSFSVWSAGSKWYAISGNRRLWVLRELSSITGKAVKVRVRQLPAEAHMSTWFRRKFTTSCKGIAVEYRANRGLHPSMKMALSSLKGAGTTLTAHETLLAQELLRSGGRLPLVELESRFGGQFSVPELLTSKPEIFARSPSEKSLIFTPVIPYLEAAASRWRKVDGEAPVQSPSGKATALTYKAPPAAKCQLAAIPPTTPAQAQGVKASPPPPPVRAERPGGVQAQAAPEPVPKPPPAQWLAPPSGPGLALLPPRPPAEAKPKPKPPPPPCASDDEDGDDAASVTPPATPTADAGKQEEGTPMPADRFPSDGFAAAARSEKTAPSPTDMAVGWVLSRAGGALPRLELKRRCNKVSTLKLKYLKDKRHLFTAEEGEDGMITFTPAPKAAESSQDSSSASPAPALPASARRTVSRGQENQGRASEQAAGAPSQPPRSVAHPPPQQRPRSQPPQIPAPLPANSAYSLQRCVCNLEGLLSKMPPKIFEAMGLNSYVRLLHRFKAQRLVLRSGKPLQVALASSWVPPSELPEVPLSQHDLLAVVEQLGLKTAGSGLQPIPGSSHRASLCYHGTSLDTLVLHVTRLLPGVSEPIHHLALGSLLLLGPASCGKTTVLRDLISTLSLRYQVVVVDPLAELSSYGFRYARALLPSEECDNMASFLQRVISEHSPEVVVAEFIDGDAALKCAQLCYDAGVRLVCSLRQSFPGLLEAFLRCQTGLFGCCAFPFATVVALRRELDMWQVYSPAGAVVCAMSAGRRARCPKHHFPNSPALHPCSVVRLKDLTVAGASQPTSSTTGPAMQAGTGRRIEAV